METLASRITRDGGLPEIDAVGWAIRVAFSVEQLHALGAVHGRLSADGILIESEKCTSEGRLIPFSELPENVAYHSPERELGEGGSQADDTWAVAVLLYLALSGSLPFSGPTDDEVRRKIRSVPAPPLAVFDIGDDALQAIVDRALARARDHRTASVGDLRRELEAWRPDARLDALPPLLGDDEPEEEVTMMIRSGISSPVREMIDAAVAAAPRKPSISPPRPAAARAAPTDDVPDGPLPAIPAAPTTPTIPRASTSEAPGPPDDDDATLMIKPGIKLPGLVDDDSMQDRADDPFAIPASRAGVPRIGTTEPASSRSQPSSPPSSGARSSTPSSSGSRPSTPPASGARPSMPSSSGSRPSTPSDAGAAASRAPAQSVAPAAPRRSVTTVALVCVAAFVAAALAASLWSSASAPQPPPAPAETTRSPVTSPSTSIEAPKSAATTSAVTASAPPAISASAAPPAGLAACVVPLFPPESFDASTDFSFVCSEADPLKGGSAVRTQLVRSHRNLSEGMKEWALLGWYEPAAFSVIRARCCPSAPPLQLPEVRGCTPVPDLLAGISTAAAATRDPADKALKKAVDAYTSNVYCIVRSGIAARFGRVGNPQGGEDTTFMRFLGQVVAAKR
jgi:hypothetical protein